MKELYLSKGMVSKVDDQDYEVLKKYKWHAVKNGHRNWYARTNIFINNKSIPLALHRIILGLYDDKIIGDHIDGDSLNNQRNNLRISTAQQNKFNSRKPLSSKTSIYKGVCFKSRPKKYYSSISIDNVKIHLGVFDDPKLAAIAYNNAAKKYFGEFAKLNVI